MHWVHWTFRQIKSRKASIRETAVIKNTSPISGFVWSGGGSQMSEMRRNELEVVDIPAVNLERRLVSVRETDQHGSTGARREGVSWRMSA